MLSCLIMAHRASLKLIRFCCQGAAMALPGEGTKMSAIKKAITTKTISNLKPAASGVAYELLDTVTPGFGIRVSASRSSYILRARFPGSPNFTRRAIAQVGEIELTVARKTAQRWKEMILEGKDPEVEIQAKATV